MQININTYQDQIFTCPNCNWQGKGSELTIENFSEVDFITDFECPKCGKPIGSGQASLRDAEDETDGAKEKQKHIEKIFELGGEGGSITFFKELDEEIGSTWYYYEVSDMGFEEEDIPPTHRKSQYAFTFWEALLHLKKEKPYFYRLYPVSLDQHFSDDIIALLRLCKIDENAEIHYKTWASALKINEFDLLIHVQRK